MKTRAAKTSDHCQKCGSEDREDVETGDSYTACCNERVVWAGDCDETCDHG